MATRAVESSEAHHAVWQDPRAEQPLGFEQALAMEAGRLGWRRFVDPTAIALSVDGGAGSEQHSFQTRLPQRRILEHVSNAVDVRGPVTLIVRLIGAHQIDDVVDC